MFRFQFINQSSHIVPRRLDAHVRAPASEPGGVARFEAGSHRPASSPFTPRGTSCSSTTFAVMPPTGILTGRRGSAATRVEFRRSSSRKKKFTGLFCRPRRRRSDVTTRRSARRFQPTVPSKASAGVTFNTQNVTVPTKGTTGAAGPRLPFRYTMSRPSFSSGRNRPPPLTMVV